MIAVDTNILLRYVVRDDPEQLEKAANFFRERTTEDPAYVSLIVVAEMIWVLRRLYRYSTEQVRAALLHLIETAELEFEEEQYLVRLLSRGAVVKFDLADHLITLSGAKAGCSHTVTFDKRAAKSVPGMELLA